MMSAGVAVAGVGLGLAVAGMAAARAVRPHR
jgi:hypothetical protein